MISLIVPVYNMETLLPRSMRSLLMQNSDYEIILVDDGSTDSSAALCDQYAIQYPELVRVCHKKNGGLSSARNAGMDMARGDFVIFPDPDDWVEPNYVEKLAELQHTTGADLVCVGYYINYDNRQIPANEGHFFQIMDRAAAEHALLLPPFMGGFAWCKLYNLKLIRAHDLRFLEDVGTTEDLDFVYRYLTYCSTICFDPESRLYHYYQRPGAATHSSFSPRKMDSLHTYEKIIDHTKDQDIICAAQEEICNTAVNLLWSCYNSRSTNQQTCQNLHIYIQKYLKQYCYSQRYGKGRKIQAIFACYAPKLYTKIKNKLTREI